MQTRHVTVTAIIVLLLCNMISIARAEQALSQDQIKQIKSTGKAIVDASRQQRHQTLFELSAYQNAINGLHAAIQSYRFTIYANPQQSETALHSIHTKLSQLETLYKQATTADGWQPLISRFEAPAAMIEKTKQLRTQIETLSSATPTQRDKILATLAESTRLKHLGMIFPDTVERIKPTTRIRTEN